jgi:hypothetical protein
MLGTRRRSTAEGDLASGRDASTAAVANLLRVNALLLKIFSLHPVEALLSLQA